MLLSKEKKCCHWEREEKFLYDENKFCQKWKVKIGIYIIFKGLSNGIFRIFEFCVVPKLHIWWCQKVSKRWLFSKKKTKSANFDVGVVPIEGYILFFMAIRMAYSEFSNSDFCNFAYMVMKIVGFIPFQTKISEISLINFCRGCPLDDIYYFFGATKWWSQNFLFLLLVFSDIWLSKTDFL